MDFSFLNENTKYSVLKGFHVIYLQKPIKSQVYWLYKVYKKVTSCLSKFCKLDK